MKKILIFLFFIITSQNCLAATPRLKLPPVGLGTVEMGRNWGIGGTRSETPDENITKKVLLTAYQNGWKLVDTASSYQASEERIARYLPKNKYQYLLVTKPGEHSILNSDPKCKQRGTKNQYCLNPAAAYDFSRIAIIRDINDSLAKLHVKNIDVALLHLQNETALATLKKGEALATLQELKQKGLIKYIGVSVNGPPALYAAKKGGIDIIELEYNLLNQNNSAAIHAAYKKGIKVIVRGGLGTGLLTEYAKDHLNEPNMAYHQQVNALVQLTKGNYDLLTRLALAFLQKEKHINTIIIGADRPEYITKDAELLQASYDPKLLDDAVSLMKKFKTPELFTESLGVSYFN